jgi:hypothetical protein
VRCEATDRSVVATENQQPGTLDWQLTYSHVDRLTGWRSPAIEGYVSRTSVRAGETLELFVSADPETEFLLEVFRLGYYGGLGGRKLLELGPYPASTQSLPPVGEKRLRECAWEACAALTIPDDWVSGVYVGKLTERSRGLQSYVIFIVRDDRPADVLFQCSDWTWAAYNRWPDHFSLYDDGADPWYVGLGVRVSFDRPYGKYCQHVDAPLSLGSGEFLLWEFPLAFWLEQHGYDVTYISNTDTHCDPDGLRRARLFLSVGHDEYWSREMYDHVRGAVGGGMSAAFLSGNSLGFLTEATTNSRGVPHRTLERVGRFDLPGCFDEAALMGARNVHPVTGVGDWTVTAHDHWLFEGTGMQAGDSIPGLVGWEWHGQPGDQPGLEVVARGRTRDHRDQEGEYTATMYPGPTDNWVLNAATIWWAQGLSAPPGHVPAQAFGGRTQGPDARVQRMTANFLARCGVTGCVAAVR